jgi:hypothetical protein
MYIITNLDQESRHDASYFDAEQKKDGTSTTLKSYLLLQLANMENGTTNSEKI